jgi:hypothetical protein
MSSLTFTTSKVGLGDALYVLGGRESGTAKLNEAVFAYRRS